MSSFVLLTGMPGCGKTTMIQQIVGEMKKGSRVPKIQGFYTQESRDARNERIGFDVVMMNGTRGILARAGSETQQPANKPLGKVGKYSVYTHEFENLCLSEIESIEENSLLIIDEIGKMELLSQRFEMAIKNLLVTNKNLKILATVPLKSPTSLIDQLKTHPKSQLFHITKSNRDEIFQKVVQATKNLFD